MKPVIAGPEHPVPSLPADHHVWQGSMTEAAAFHDWDPASRCKALALHPLLLPTRTCAGNGWDHVPQAAAGHAAALQRPPRWLRQSAGRKWSSSKSHEHLISSSSKQQLRSGLLEHAAVCMQRLAQDMSWLAGVGVPKSWQLPCTSGLSPSMQRPGPHLLQRVCHVCRDGAAGITHRHKVARVLQIHPVWDSVCGKVVHGWEGIGLSMACPRKATTMARTGGNLPPVSLCRQQASLCQAR